MFENPRRGRQERNFTTNVPKILDLKSSSEQIFLRKLSLGAPVLSKDQALDRKKKKKNSQIKQPAVLFCSVLLCCFVWLLLILTIISLLHSRF